MLFKVAVFCCVFFVVVVAKEKCEYEENGKKIKADVGEGIEFGNEYCLCEETDEEDEKAHFRCVPMTVVDKKRSIKKRAGPLFKRNPAFCSDWNEDLQREVTFSVGERMILQGSKCMCQGSEQGAHIICEYRKKRSQKKRTGLFKRSDSGCTHTTNNGLQVTYAVGERFQLYGSNCLCDGGDYIICEYRKKRSQKKRTGFFKRSNSGRNFIRKREDDGENEEENHEEEPCNKGESETFGNYRCTCENSFGAMGKPLGLDWVCKLEGCYHETKLATVKPNSSFKSEDGRRTCTCVKGPDPQLMDYATLYHLKCVEA